MGSSTPKSQGTRLGRAVLVVGLFTLSSRILGLLRDMVLASLFGSGMAADAFFVAFRIPNLLRRLFAEGSLTISFIPVFSEYLARKGRADAFELARVVLTVLTLIIALASLLGILLAPWIVRLQAFGFGDSGLKYDLTVLLTRITFPYIFLISIVALFMGILNAVGHFAAPAAAPVLLNLAMIGSAYLLSPFLAEPIIGVAVGVLMGGILQVALQMPWVLKEGFTLAPRWKLYHPGLKRIGLLMTPAIFGSAVYQLNQFVGTLLASFLPEGSISWLYYADRLVQFPLGVFAISISTAALPSLSHQAANSAMDEFRNTFSNALRLVFFITLPSAVGLMVLGEPIIRVLLERGAFGPESTLMTQKALLCYAMGLWAFSGIRIVVSAFYALQDTKTPVQIAVIALLVNLMVSLGLMGPLKHTGLALALSISSAIQFFLLMSRLRKRVELWSLKPLWLTVLKSTIASGVMGVGIYLGERFLFPVVFASSGMAKILNTGVLLLLGVSLYLGLAKVLGCVELGAMSRIRAR